ncbi:MAG: plastocyanin/azurin family copper-binding protein [Burkholderiales bacterium]
MNGLPWLRWLACVWLASIGLHAAAANHTVVVGGPDGHAGFAPKTLVIKGGDSVTWQWAGAADMAHNVVADGRFRCAHGCDGEGGDGTPSATAWSVTRTFTASGIVNYYCEIHLEVGMTGVIVVQDAAGNPPPPTVRAVEYYYADWNYYFMTSFPDEVATLDGGAFGGVWKRTGRSFEVWDSPVPGSVATCRFFSTTFAPKSSHFYTPFASECAGLKKSPDWQFESVAFYMALTNASGECDAGTQPLYRLYNNGMGGAPNHRYTTSAEVFAQMKAAGWVYEGDGRTGVFGCTPAPVGPPVRTTGVWRGTTAAGEPLVVIILENGALYVLYDGGAIAGKSAVSGSDLVVSQAVDFPFANGAETGEVPTPATVSASYTAAGTLQLSAKGLRTLTATVAFDEGSDQPPPQADPAGNYSGITGHVGGSRSATATLASNGTFTGRNAANCSLTGAFTPRASVRAYDWTVIALNDNCIFGKGPITGILYYDPVKKEVRGLAPYGVDAYYLVATKP